MRILQILTLALLAAAARADTFFLFGFYGAPYTGGHVGTKYTNGLVPNGDPNSGGGFFPWTEPIELFGAISGDSWKDASWLVDSRIGCCVLADHPDHLRVEVDDPSGQAIAFVDFHQGDSYLYYVSLIMPTPGIPLLSLINDIPPPGPTTLHLVESDVFQEAMHVRWNDGTIDTIEVAFIGTPEPSSWLLLGTVVIGLCCRRRWRPR
jgi:hypothetical protein